MPETDNAAPAPASPSRLAQAGRRSWRDRLRALRGPIVALAGVGAVLSGLAGYWNTWRTVRDAASVAAPVVPGSAQAALSIMVLPFRMLDGDAARAYIADGLTSGVTQDLGRIRDAFVLPAATAYAYRSKAMTLQALAHDAGVRFVLTGEVQAQGTRLLIRAQLTDGASGRQLWSEDFEGDSTDLFKMQEQITARIANGTERELVVVAAGESRRRHGTPQAADLNLRLRALGLKPASLARSIEAEQLQRQWLKLEPDNPEALAILSLNLMIRVVNFKSEVPAALHAQLVAEGTALSERALALDSNNTLALAARAEALRFQHQGEAAIRLMSRVVELDPKNRGAFNQLGLWLLSTEPERGLEQLRKGLALDPKHPDMFELNIGTGELYLGRYAQAQAMGERCAATHPDFAYCRELLAAAHAMQGHADLAREAAATLLKLAPYYRLGVEFPIVPQARPDVRAHQQAIQEALRRLGLPD